MGRYRMVAEILRIEKFHVWQEEYLAGISERRRDGSRKYRRTVLLIGRQGGKSHAIPTVAFADALDGKKVGITQQERSKITERWQDWMTVWESNAPPEVRGEVTRGAGKEVWRLPNGGEIRPLTPNGTHVRGFDLDTLIVDESAYVPKAFYAAASFTLATKPDAVVHYMCTAGDRRDPKSVEFDNAVSDAKAGADGYYLMEYAGKADTDPSDRKQWPKLIPTLGCSDPQGVTWQFVEDEHEKHRRAGTLDVFAREMLGVWTEIPVALSLDGETWRLLGDATAKVGNGATLAVDCGRNRTKAAICSAKADKNGCVTSSVVEYRDGADWVVPFLKKMRAKYRGRIERIVIDTGSPASSYIADLRLEGFKVEGIGTGEMIAYYGKFMDLVAAGRERFRHRPNEDLQAAVEAGQVRAIRDGYGWDRRLDDAGCLLTAETIAVGRAAAKPVGVDILI